MMRALALVERDMRKFRRSPALLFASLVMPLLQLIILGNAFGGNIKNAVLGVVNLDRGRSSDLLIILGNAFGGNIKNAVLGVVNLDRGPQSVDVLERLRAVGANARTFLPT